MMLAVFFSLFLFLQAYFKIVQFLYLKIDYLNYSLEEIPGRLVLKLVREMG